MGLRTIGQLGVAMEAKEALEAWRSIGGLERHWRPGRHCLAGWPGSLGMGLRIKFGMIRGPGDSKDG